MPPLYELDDLLSPDQDGPLMDDEKIRSELAVQDIDTSAAEAACTPPAGDEAEEAGEERGQQQEDDPVTGENGAKTRQETRSQLARDDPSPTDLISNRVSEDQPQAAAEGLENTESTPTDSDDSTSRLGSRLTDQLFRFHGCCLDCHRQQAAAH